MTKGHAQITCTECNRTFSQENITLEEWTEAKEHYLRQRLHLHSHSCGDHSGLSWDALIWVPIEFWSEDWETKAEFTPSWRTLMPRPPQGPPPPSHALSDESSSALDESQPPVEVSPSEVMVRLDEVYAVQMDLLTHMNELRDTIIQTQDQLTSVAVGATEMNAIVIEIQHKLLEYLANRMPYSMPPPPPPGPAPALAALPRALHPVTDRQRSRSPMRRSPTPLRFATDTRGMGGSGGSSGLDRDF